MMAKVISVYNLKGGTGKTFLAHILTAYLAYKGYKVLAVDLDQQANFTVSLVPEQSLSLISQVNISHLFYPQKYKSDPDKLLVGTVIPDVDLLAATLDLAEREMDAYTIPQSSERLKMFIDLVEDRYDYVVVDNPPAFNIYTTNGFIASNHVVIPVYPSVFAIEGLEKVVKILINMVDFNPRLSITAIVPNMIDKRYKMHNATIKYLQHLYDAELTKPIGRRSEYQKILDDVGKSRFLKMLKNPSEDIQELLEVLDEIIKKIETKVPQEEIANG